MLFRTYKGYIILSILRLSFYLVLGIYSYIIYVETQLFQFTCCFAYETHDLLLDRKVLTVNQYISLKKVISHP